mgnify:CR=1 FL=1
MMIRWLDDAVHDLQSLRSYIAQDNAMAARKVVQQLGRKRPRLFP